MKEILNRFTKIGKSEARKKKSAPEAAAITAFANVLTLSHKLKDVSLSVDDATLPFYEFFTLSCEDRETIANLSYELSCWFASPLTDAIALLSEHSGRFAHFSEVGWTNTVLIYNKVRANCQARIMNTLYDLNATANDLRFLSFVCSNKDQYPKIAIKNESAKFIVINNDDFSEIKQLANPEIMLIDISAATRAYRQMEYEFIDAVCRSSDAEEVKVSARLRLLRRSFLNDWSILTEKWSMIDGPIVGKISSKLRSDYERVICKD